MDWKLTISFGALLVSLLSLMRTEVRGHALRCQLYEEGQWTSLRKEIEGRRDEFEKSLVNFRNLVFEDASLDDDIKSARQAYKDLLQSHSLLLRSGRRCAANSCASQGDAWSLVALRPVSDHDTVIDQTGEACNAIAASVSVETAEGGIGQIAKLFDEMIDGLDTMIRIENAYHDPGKFAPMPWLPRRGIAT